MVISLAKVPEAGPSTPSRRHVRVAVGIASATLICIVLAGLFMWPSGSAHSLRPWPGPFRARAAASPTGTTYFHGVAGFRALGRDPVRFRAARVLSVPSGVEVLSIRASHFSRTGHY